MPSPLLSIKKLSRKHPSKQGFLLHPTDISIFAGDRICIHGNSGSGKSILLRAIAQVDTTNYQNITFLDNDIKNLSIPYYRSQIQLVHQNVVLIDGSVEDNIRFAQKFAVHDKRHYNSSDILQALDYLQLPKSFLQCHSNDLSGGERQIANLLRSVSLSPRILLLDEPSAALDGNAALLLENYVHHWLHSKVNERAYVWISHSTEQMQRIANNYWHVDNGFVEFDSSLLLSAPEKMEI